MKVKNDTQNTFNLQQTIRFFERLLSASADGIVITDPAKNIIFVNDTFCTFFSRKRQDVLETNLFIWLENLDHNAKDIWKGLETQINENGIAKNIEFAMKTGEGTRYFSVNSSLLEKIDIEETGIIISIWRDDTERKVAKEALQKANDELEMRVKERTAQLSDKNIELNESKQFIESIINLSPDILYIYDLIEHKNVYSNDGIQNILDYSVKEVREMGGNLLSILMNPDDFKIYLEEIYPEYSKLKDKQPIIHEYRMKHKNGQWRWLDCSEIIYMRQQDGSPKQILGVVHDITQRKQAEEALHTERDNLVRIFEAMDDGVYIVDQKYDIHYVNLVLEKDFGPWEGRKCFEYFHDRTQVCPWCKNEDVFAGKTVRWEWYSSKNDKTYDLIDTPLINPDGTIYKLELFRDITQRKQVEERLRESEERFKSIFDNALDGILVADIETKKNMFGNNMICRMLGFEEDEIKNTSVWDFHPEKDLPYVLEQFEKQARQEIGLAKDIPMKRKDGSVFYADINSTTITLGGKTYLLGIFRDITERKRVEEALVESERRIRHAQEISGLGYWELTVDTGELYWSDLVYTQYGLEKTFHPSNDVVFEMIHPDDRDYVLKAVQATLDHDAEYNIVVRVMRPDGKLCYIHTLAEVTRDAQGKPIKLVGTQLDITKRKQAEDEKNRLLKAIASSTDGITICDEKDLYIYVNAAYARIFSYFPEDFIGETWRKITPSDLISGIEKGLEETLHNKDKGLFKGEVPGLRKDGSIVPTEVMATGLWDENGNYSGHICIVRDITKRKQAEEALRESEEKYRTLVERSNDGILIIQEGLIKFANIRLAQLWGGSVEELLETSITSHIHPKERDKVIDNYNRRLANENIPSIYETILLSNDGTAVNIEINAGVINYNGKPADLVMVRDITERKQAEEELLKSRALLNETQRISRIGGGEYDVITGKMTWTEEIYHIYGVTPADYDPNDIDRNFEFYSKEDQVKIECAFKNAVEKGESYDLELKFRNAIGKDMWVRTIGKPEFKDGRIVRVYGNIMDITDSMVAQEQNMMLKYSLDVFYDGIYWLDTDNKFIYVNDAGCKIFGYSREELLTMTVHDVNPRATEYTMKLAWDQLRKKGFFTAESVHRRKDGTEFPVEIRSTYVQFAGREYIGGYARDLSEQKRAENERILLLEREHEAHTEAEAAKKLDRMKSMFLASTSHELRTPLNSVIGFSSLLLEGCSGQLNPEQKEQLEIVHTCGKHLLTLINEIIDISKIEAGNINLNVTEFKLRPLVDDVVSMLKVSFFEKKLDLKVNVQDIVMRSDRKRLLQCIMNLVSNAIKYTQEGSVEITAMVINNNVIITVTDTGIGIETNDIPRIFGPFVRLQTPLTYKTSGTGLGLYMVKKIVKDFLGGDVEVKSEFGKGSTFKLHVPVEIEA